MTRVKAAEMMGALYEDVEKFFGDIFAWYGRIVARCPLPFVFLPVLVCGLLGLGLLQVRYETDLEKLYTPVDSKAFEDKEAVAQLFSDEGAWDYYPYQQVLKGPYAELILRPPSSGGGGDDGRQYDPPPNVLQADALEEISNIVHFVHHNISVARDGKDLFYRDVCATRLGECAQEGLHILSWVVNSTENGCVNVSSSSTGPSQRGLDLDMDKLKLLNVLADVNIFNNCMAASALRLRFSLSKNGSERTDWSQAWEEQFLRVMKRYKSDRVEFRLAVSESLNIELSKPVERDLVYFSVALGVMLIYATVIGSGGNCVTNHVTLAYAGVMAALLAIVASFGFLSLCGLPFVNICAVMPFMVLGLGADDMFQLMTEWRQTNIRDTIADRMSQTLRSAAVSITITSMTNLLAFLIGATSPFLSVKNFCACSGVAVVMCYVNQLTFFSGCIVLHAQRVQASRHCVTCLPTTSREEMEDEHKNTVHIVLCSGHAPRKAGDEGGLCRKLSRVLYTIYPRFILHWITKCFVMLLFFSYAGLSIWGASQLQQGLKFQDVLDENSYLRQYIQWESKYYPLKGPVIMFVIDEPVDYHTPTVQRRVVQLLQEAILVDCVQDGSQVSWLQDLITSVNSSTSWSSEAQLVSHLVTDFLPRYPQYARDVKLDDKQQAVVASRLYVTCHKLHSTRQEVELIKQMRSVSNDSPLPVSAYSTEFLYYEADISILKNTLLAVGVTMIGMLFVALVFIPHPIAVTCVTLSMFSVVVGMKGFMFFWHLTLSAFTTIQIIISVGICVNFTVQISHAFMTATGKNRNERVTVALEKVGIPILNGAFSSILCIFILFLGQSYVFTSMFKTMLLVAILGLLHSLVFLPVMLSFIGPRRTSKPRVFIPVSPSSRSLQDTYRANSIARPPATEPLKKRRNPLIVRSDTDPALCRSKSDSDIYPELKQEEADRRRVSLAYGHTPIRNALAQEALARRRFSLTPEEVDSIDDKDISVGTIVIEATPSPVIKFKLLPRITDSDDDGDGDSAA